MALLKVIVDKRLRKDNYTEICTAAVTSGDVPYSASISELASGLHNPIFSHWPL